MGQPLRVAELIAQLDGPVYVERVALYDARQRLRARKAITKALRLQVEGRGYAFVEVLSECPTHLKASAGAAEEWIRTQMEPVFPLGVKKDCAVDPWFHPPAPSFDPEAVLALSGAEPAPSQVGAGHAGRHPLGARDRSLKLAGAGGDGAQTAALLLARAAIAEGFDATHIPSYGPESRGGTSYADVHIAEEEVLNPSASEPDILIAFNAPSLARFAASVPEGGLILYDSTVITEPGELPDHRRVMAMPFTGNAADLKRPLVKNLVALGALEAASGILPQARILETLRQLLKDKPSALPVNEAAFAAGQKAVAQASA